MRELAYPNDQDIVIARGVYQNDINGTDHFTRNYKCSITNLIFHLLSNECK